MPGQDVAEVARWHGEAHGPVILLGHLQPTRDVVDDLGHDAAPVHRVDGAEMVTALEFEVTGDKLHEVLAIVEDPSDGNIANVGVEDREHLRGLERAGLA